MTTRTRRVGALSIAIVTGTAAFAYAAEGPGLTASYTSGKPNTGISATAELGGAELVAAQAGKAIRSLKLQASQGLKFDKTGVIALCTPDQAKSVTCPDSSSVGGGTATLNSPAVGDVPATAKLYLTAPATAGDIAGVQVVANALGQKLALPGRIVASASGPYFLLPDVDKNFPLPLTVKALKLTFGSTAPVKKTKTITVTKRVKGKKKKVKKKVTVTVKQSLLTTPATCPAGGWTAASSIGFTDGSTYDSTTTIPCTP